VIAQLGRRIVRHQVGRGLHVGLRQAVAVADEQAQLLEYPLGPNDVRLGAFDDEILAGRADLDPKAGLEALEVLVEGPEEGLDALLGKRDRA